MWTYPTTLWNGTLVSDHVPFTGVSFSDSLNDGGSFTGSCRCDLPFLPVDMRSTAGRYITWPMKNGRVFGAYTWTTGPATDTGQVLQSIQATRSDSIFKFRLIAHDLVFTQKDQLDVARDLFRYGMGQPPAFTAPTVLVSEPFAALPWLRLDPLMSGVLIDRTKVVNGQDDDGYRAKGRKSIAEAVSQLADNLNGFEYRFDTGIDSAGFFGMVRFGYPKVGTPANLAERVSIESPGGNVASANYGWDSANFATRVDVVGGEAGGVPIVGSATNATLLAQGFPLRTVSLSLSNVTDLAALNARAAAELALRDRTDGYAVVLDGNRPPTLGTYNIGDYVTLRVKRGGAALDERVVRVIGWTIKVDDTGTRETVTPVLSDR